MTQTHIHPKSLPITKGWSQIGPPSPRRREVPAKELAGAFRKTLAIQENRRIRKLRHKLATGVITSDEAVIGVLEASLSVKPPRVFTQPSTPFRKIEKKVAA